MDTEQEKEQEQRGADYHVNDALNNIMGRIQNRMLSNMLNKQFGGLAEKGSGAVAGRVASGAPRAGALFMNPVGAGILVFVLVVVILVFVLGNQAGGTSTNPSPTSTETSINTTKTNLNVTFYCQYDAGWTSSCNIIKYGCDPTSLAMIFTSFGDTQWTPSYTATNNNYVGCFGATNKTQTLNAIEKMSSFGYTKGPNLALGKDFNLDLVKQYIDNDYLIHAAANVYYRAGTGYPLESATAQGGHSFVITGVDPIAKTVTILDPTFCNSDTNYITKTMNVQNDILGDGWFWAYPIKKVVNTQ